MGLRARRPHTANTSSRVELANHADLNSTTAITFDFEFMIHAHDGVNRMLAWKEGTYNLRFTSAEVGFNIGAQTVNRGSGLTLANPYHVACIYDGSNLKMRITNLVTGASNLHTTAKTGAIPTSTDPFVLCNRSSAGDVSFRANATVWRFRMWKNIAISDAEATWDALRAVANVGDTTDPAWPVGVAQPTRAYELGEASPETESNGGTTATVSNAPYSFKPSPGLTGAPRNVALIRETTASSNWLTHMQALGHTVTTLNDDAIGAAYDFSAYDLIVVSGTSNIGSIRADIATAIRAAVRPAIIVFEGQYASGTGRTNEVPVHMDLVSSLAEGTSIAGTWDGRLNVLSVVHDFLDAAMFHDLPSSWITTVLGSGNNPALLDSGGSYVGTGLAELANITGANRPCFIAIESGTTDLAAGTTPARYFLTSFGRNSGAGTFDAPTGYIAREWIHRMIEWVAIVSPPNAPTIDAVTSITETNAVVEGSVYSHPSAVAQQNRQFRIRRAGSVTIVHTSALLGAVTDYTIPVGTLLPGRLYEVSARDQDVNDSFSAWGDWFEFTTLDDALQFMCGNNPAWLDVYQYMRPAWFPGSWLCVGLGCTAGFAFYGRPTGPRNGFAAYLQKYEIHALHDPNDPTTWIDRPRASSSRVRAAVGLGAAAIIFNRWGGNEFQFCGVIASGSDDQGGFYGVVAGFRVGIINQGIGSCNEIGSATSAALEVYIFAPNAGTPTPITATILDPSQIKGRLLKCDSFNCIRPIQENFPELIWEQLLTDDPTGKTYFLRAEVAGAVIERTVVLSTPMPCGYDGIVVESPGRGESLTTEFVSAQVAACLGPSEPYLQVLEYCGDLTISASCAGDIVIRRVSDSVVVWTSPAPGTSFSLLWGTLPNGDYEAQLTCPDDSVTPWIAFTVPDTHCGEPCDVILQVYEDDRQTIAWEVGTNPNHPYPFLDVPSNYGEQEIDIVAGAASIGQVEAILIDKAQIAGDQDSGWLTEKLADRPHGRRCRMLRYISDALGWIVIADGPADTPRLDESYSAFRWMIRDTRETERKTRAFVEDGSNTLLPQGVLNGFGYDAATATWLVDPTEWMPGSSGLNSDLTGAYAYVDLSAAPTALRTILNVSYYAMEGDTEYLGPVYQIGPDFFQDYQTTFGGRVLIYWRLAGETAFNIIRNPVLTGTVIIGGIIPVWTNLAQAAAGDPTRVVDAVAFGDADDPTNIPPTNDAAVEIMIIRRGVPTSIFPFHLEGITTGELLVDLYNGVYSTRDAVTGALIPTGIRFDETAVLAMTDPVLLRLTEPVKDVRDFAEKFIYAPTGWVAALDNDGQISPVSQIPPQSFDGTLEITNAITEPQPDWNAGEHIVNVLKFTYPRYYIPSVGTVEAADGMAVRDVEFEYRDEDSITKHGEQVVEFDGAAFGAIGDGNGASLTATSQEQGYTLALLRKLYVFDRFRRGAQVIRVPVMRIPTATTRAGDWVRPTLSWFPDYTTLRRGMVTQGQVIAIADLDCAWRELLIEEAFPVPES